MRYAPILKGFLQPKIEVNQNKLSKKEGLNENIHLGLLYCITIIVFLSQICTKETDDFKSI